MNFALTFMLKFLFENAIVSLLKNSMPMNGYEDENVFGRVLLKR